MGVSGPVEDLGELDCDLGQCGHGLGEMGKDGVDIGRGHRRPVDGEVSETSYGVLGGTGAVDHLGTWPLHGRLVGIVVGGGGAVMVGVHGCALLPV